MGHHQLDTLDEQILQLIADNARIPFLEVARACNVSGAAIHQRIQKLYHAGIHLGPLQRTPNDPAQQLDEPGTDKIDDQRQQHCHTEGNEIRNLPLEILHYLIRIHVL